MAVPIMGSICHDADQGVCISGKALLAGGARRRCCSTLQLWRGSWVWGGLITPRRDDNGAGIDGCLGGATAGFVSLITGPKRSTLWLSAVIFERHHVFKGVTDGFLTLIDDCPVLTRRQRSRDQLC